MTHGHEDDRTSLAEVERRMRPGSFSQVGFLGPEESLREVLANDARALDELGVSAHALADRLGELLEATVGSKATTARAGPYTIRVRRYKGPQICPFAPQPYENPCPAGGPIWLASIDWDIDNSRNRARLSGPGLIVHLIGAHRFFEGLESPYRVAPRALAELLELGPFAG